MSYKPLVLVIMDGVGLSAEKRGNAVAMANLPHLRAISRTYPGTALQAAGLTVGIPWGEVGNSEVGHTAIGSGLIKYQNLARVNQAIAKGEFFNLPIWQKIIDHAVKNHSAIHLVGLVSNGGIHSHQEHLWAILKLLADRKFGGPVFIHAFTDGRDTPIKSAITFIKLLEDKVAALGVGRIATVSGRHYAMDRDQRWEQTSIVYEVMTAGSGQKFASAQAALNYFYSQEVTDEFIKPSVIVDESQNPVGTIKANDAAVFFNFRPDRARQLAEAFIKSPLVNLFLVSLTQYDEKFTMPVIFPAEYVAQPLAQIISAAGLKQLHIAETEKYAHVTYFLNGGREKPFAGEERIVIPSPRVSSYDEQPAMSAYETTKELVTAVEKRQHDFIAINFANGDMVGHTGNLEASIKATEVVDECIGVITKAVLAVGGAVIITADHGNCEEMVNLETGQKDTEHSVNPAPFWLVAPDNQLPPTEDTTIKVGGILPDVAPTILELLNLPKPLAMIGNSLLRVILRQPI